LAFAFTASKWAFALCVHAFWASPSSASTTSVGRW